MIKTIDFIDKLPIISIKSKDKNYPVTYRLMTDNYLYAFTVCMCLCLIVWNMNY